MNHGGGMTLVATPTGNGDGDILEIIKTRLLHAK